MKKSAVPLLLLLQFLLCSNYENPFTNPFNANIFITKDKTSFNTDSVSTILIFSKQTLTVTTTVPEQLLWLYVEISHNRLPPFDTVWHPKAIDYSFSFSCYDEGLQTIKIFSRRVNGDPIYQEFYVRTKSPLHQIDLADYEFGDSINLATDPVLDPVHYNWKFGAEGTVYSSPFSNWKTVIKSTVPFDNKGVLFINDSIGFSSPADTFTFSFHDNTPPLIICVNNIYDKEKQVVRTTDTIFHFKILATDRNDLLVKSLEFNGEQEDMRNNNIYTKVIKDMQFHPADKPLKMTVKATDNLEFGNVTTETFFLVYDKNAIDEGVSVLDIINIKEDSVITSVNRLPLLFNITNTVNRPVIIQSKINDSLLYDTAFINGSGLWKWIIPLDSGKNTFEISVIDNNKDIQSKRIIFITLKENIKDQTPPFIYSFKLTDADTGIGDQVIYSEKDSIEFFVRASDLQSGIKSLSINSDIIPVNPSQTEWKKKYRNTSHFKPENFVLSVTDNQNNTSKDSLLVCSNHVPYFTSSPSLPYLLNVGNVYIDTLIAIDEDKDPITFKIRSVPSNMIIDSIGRLFFKPDTSNCGEDTIIVQLTDGYQFSRFYTWPYRIIDPPNDRPSIKLLRNLQFPSFIQVGESLKTSVLVDTSTGHPPFLYTASVTPSNTVLLSNSESNNFTWIPLISDTGEQLITCIVEDSSYQQYDTLKKSILVVRPNSDPCSLSLPENIINNKQLNLYGLKDTFKIEFIINDSDHPLTEEHTVTIVKSGVSTDFTPKGDNFTIGITPTGKELDTISVTIKDKTVGSNGYSVQIPIIFRLPNLSDIPNLVIWNPPEKLQIIDNIIYWNSNPGYDGRFRSEETNNPEIYPNSLNGHSIIKFYRNDHLDNEKQNVLSIDSGFSIFAVVQFSSDKSYENRTIISSSSSSQVTGFGVDYSGHPLVYSKNASNFLITNDKSSFSAPAGKWFVVSYRSSGIRLGSLQVVTSVNTLFDTISIANPAAGAQLTLGSSTNISNNAQYFGWIGEMAEIAVFKRRLSENETNTVVKHLFDKFALRE